MCAFGALEEALLPVVFVVLHLKILLLSAPHQPPLVCYYRITTGPKVLGGKNYLQFANMHRSKLEQGLHGITPC